MRTLSIFRIRSLYNKTKLFSSHKMKSTPMIICISLIIGVIYSQSIEEDIAENNFVRAKV